MTQGTTEEIQIVPDHIHSWTDGGSTLYPLSETFISIVDPKPGEYILDLGCGNGEVYFHAAPRLGPRGLMIGIDIKDSNIAEARSRLKKEVQKDWPGVEFLQHDICDLGSLPLLRNEAEGWDVITVASALALLQEPEKAVRHWMHYLRPGGRLVFGVPQPCSGDRRIVAERVSRRSGIQHRSNRDWIVNENSLVRLLGCAGLIVDRMVVFKMHEKHGGGERYHRVEDGEQVFEESFTKHYAEEVRQKAKDLFKEEWKKAAEDGERVREVHGFLVAAARKPADPIGPIELAGGCRCGKVRYTASVSPSPISYCHCQTCRKLSGGPYMPFIDVPSSAVKFAESTALRIYSATEEAERGFCCECGSPIFMKYHNEPDRIGLLMGSVDDDRWDEKLHTQEAHIYLREKAPWFKIPEDGWPRHAAMTDKGEVE
ncbi:hypothetical protein H2201_004918 [Coniosporium apollinis]|uniref:CENP-V/GFA domain-containing protein n=1 Tax=Coniosporium apollinis TaxID=61459 RepID=A0ABQ9NSC2_9PEZI|nr:hypothetical protein H2201_004918 [Coniosporium apollinis]